MSRRGERVGEPCRGAVLAVAFCALAAPLPAQTNLETNSAIRFNFSAPGAANLALGGAFIGLAFDGTAAYTNPAGLTTIVEPETWLDMRYWRYTHVFTDHGRIEGEDPTKRGLDTERGLQTAEASDSILGPSFVSYVHPGRDWSVAVYGHRLLDFEADFSTQGAFLERVRNTNPQGFGVLGERTGRLPALRNRMETEINSFGLAAAYRFGRSVSVGSSASFHSFRIDSVAERYVPQSLFLRPTFETSELRNSQTQQGDDVDWSLCLGALWQSPKRTWSAGAVYRQGPDFGFQTRSAPAADRDDFNRIDNRAVFHVPDIYGLGFAWRPTDRVTLAVDYDRVEYSDLLDDLTDIFDLPALFPGTDGELGAFHIDDADEVHAGVELWLPARGRAISLRLGSWFDPDHTLRFEGQNVAYRAVFRGGSDQLHWTGGVGVALRTLQVDVAFDYSDRIAVGSISAGRRF